ncbi:MAG: hypothetical protein O7B25_08300 [Gammaproteobacteria bacterium]|nr:hypothetical protein [Gammaproteobacteria bacterium]
MAEQSVYSAPSAQLEMPRETGTFGGFNRLQYFLFSMGVGLVNLVLMTMFADSPVVGMISLVAAVGVSIYIVVMRLKNVGSSAWWTLAFIVPLLNIYVGLMCLAFPEGYRSHKQLDGPAKIIIGLFLGVFVLGIVAAVALPMMLTG